MKIIRPITSADYPSFESFAFKANLGIISLPKDPRLLRQKISDSIEAFSENRSDPHSMLYIFILEDLETKKVEGTCGIKAKTGGLNPIYFYKITEEHNSTTTPYVPHECKILRPIVYQEGPSEICGLYLLPDSRKGGLGKLLSLSRFLFMACHPKRFEQAVFADMRGVFDGNNSNLFWEKIGRHFFDVPIETALDMATHTALCIPEILPKYPIYISLLPKEVQEVIGKTHPNTKPALQMLFDEGFRFMDEVNIFDGGPRIISPTTNIRTINQSVQARVEEVGQPPSDDHLSIICNTQLDFRACLSGLIHASNKGVILSSSCADALKVKKGDWIRYVSAHAISN